MTEREREEELFKRAENRENLKKRFEIQKKLKQQQKLRAKEKSAFDLSCTLFIQTREVCMVA